jgi:exosortase
MTEAGGTPRLDVDDWRERLPHLLGGAAFLWLFWEPIVTLGRDWWSDPEAGHGLLLGPLAGYLIWKSGLADHRSGQRVLGLAILAGAILLRVASALAAELFTMRMSLLGAAAGLVVYAWGFRQLLQWWLPATLLVLSVPLPSVVLSSLAFPLQLRASEMGAAMLQWRDVPVLLSGNIIHLPGQSLFVTEACSGLRSLTALISLGVLMGGLWLRTPALRALLLLITIPVAMVINGGRIFLTGFLVYFVDPALGDGFMHYTEGWALFVVAFAILGLMTWGLSSAERRVRRRVGRAPVEVTEEATT